MNRQSEYKREMDTLHFTEEQKENLVKSLLQSETAETAAPVRHRRPWKRMAVIATAAVLVLAVGAGATGLLRPASEAFAGILGFGPAETEIVDRIGRPIGASDTKDGITITADAILGDPYNVCVVYTLEAADPTLFDGLEPNEYGYLPLMFSWDDLDLGIMGGSHGGSYFMDQEPGDNIIQYVSTRSLDRPLQMGRGVKAVLGELRRGDDGTVLAEGKWKLNFTLDYEDLSISLGNGETFTQNGMDFTVDQITLSPLALKVDYTVNQEVQWSDAPSGKQDPQDAEEMRRYFENVEILLTKTDGTVLDLSNCGGSIGPKDGVTVCSKSTVFQEILPLEEVASLTVGGVEIPVR